MSGRPGESPKIEGTGYRDAKHSLAELLFGESAEASLSGSTLAGTHSRIPSPEEASTISPEAFIEAYRLNVAENEAREN